MRREVFFSGLFVELVKTISTLTMLINFSNMSIVGYDVVVGKRLMIRHAFSSNMYFSCLCMELVEICQYSGSIMSIYNQPTSFFQKSPVDIPTDSALVS